MLIIGRRAGESIWIGEDIEIRVVDLTPSRVRIGLIAPHDCPIRRGEIRETEAQNRAAAELDPGRLHHWIGRMRQK